MMVCDWVGIRFDGDGDYQPIERTTAPDAPFLKGHSDDTGARVQCWEHQLAAAVRPLPRTAYLESLPEVWQAREAAEAQASMVHARARSGGTSGRLCRHVPERRVAH